MDETTVINGTSTLCQSQASTTGVPDAAASTTTVSVKAKTRALLLVSQRDLALIPTSYFGA